MAPAGRPPSVMGGKTCTQQIAVRGYIFFSTACFEATNAGMRFACAYRELGELPGQAARKAHG
jgi:hypothetical protein